MILDVLTDALSPYLRSLYIQDSQLIASASHLRPSQLTPESRIEYPKEVCIKRHLLHYRHHNGLCYYSRSSRQLL